MHRELEAWQQVALAWQQVAEAIWQVGAGFSAAAVLVEVVVASLHEVCWQHLVFGALQHLILAGLQQSLASAAPLKAARTAKVALNATNFRMRLMLSPFQL